MIVRIKKVHPDAVIPNYAHEGEDAALDLTAVSMRYDPDHQYWEYDTGLIFEIPKNHVGLLFPRSSISNKELILTCSVGVLDSGYRDTVKFRFKILRYNTEIWKYEPGDRVGQILILPYPHITLVEVDTLESSARGEQGYGSTDK